MEAPDNLTLPPWTRTLGHAGLIPFVACAAAMLALPDAETRRLVERTVLGYGAVILSFLGGVHWGLVLRGGGGRAPAMLAIGVVPALVGWVTLLLPFETAVAVQVAAFGGFWLYEHRALGPGILPPAYLGLRRVLTLVVVASLGIALMAPSLVPVSS